MKYGHLLAVAFAVSGCVTVSTSGGGAAGTAGAAAAGGAGGTGTMSAVQGTSCGADPTTGVTLCLGISLCPGIVIDGDTYPECGFAVHGNALDVECVCGGLLCPLGAASTCDALAKLLAEENEGAVCSGAQNGGCQEIPGMTTASSGPVSSCNTACRDQCGGDPNCIIGCGC